MNAPEDLYRLHFVEDVQLSPDASTAAYVVSTLEPEAPRRRIHIHGQGLFTDGSAPRWSPDGRTLALLRDGRLHVTPADRAQPRRLADLECGPAAWSPDGTRLLVASPRPPLPRDVPRVITRAWQKADGQGGVRPSRLHLVALDGTVTPLDDAYDVTPAWSPDGRRIAFGRMRETGYALSDLWVADADGGGATILTREVSRARCPSWSPDGRLIAFYGLTCDPQTFGDPMVGVWLVPSDGSGLPCRLDLGDRAIGFMPPQYVESGPQWDGTRIIVPVTSRGSVHLLAIDVTCGDVTPLIEGPRQVTAYSFVGGRLATVIGDVRDPGDVYLDGERVTAVNEGLLDDLAPVAMREFDTPSGPVEGWVYGTGHGCPLLIDVHGGPHSFIGNGFAYGHAYRYVLAARGWVVVALNAHGSGSYGKAFADAVRGGWGEVDLPEHLAAVDAMIAEGVADPARVAITGYSYGGFMTCWALTHTDRFKVGVAGGAVTDLEAMYGTSDIGPWFGLYETRGDLWDTRETYRRLSPIQYTDRVTAPLLMMHGEADDRCPIGQTEGFYTALAMHALAPCEMVRYPDAAHLLPYSGRPSFRVDYCRRLIDWMERWITA